MSETPLSQYCLHHETTSATSATCTSHPHPHPHASPPPVPQGQDSHARTHTHSLTLWTNEFVVKRTHVWLDVTRSRPWPALLPALFWFWFSALMSSSFPSIAIQANPIQRTHRRAYARTWLRGYYLLLCSPNHCHLTDRTDRPAGQNHERADPSTEDSCEVDASGSQSRPGELGALAGARSCRSHGVSLRVFRYEPRRPCHETGQQ